MNPYDKESDKCLWYSVDRWSLRDSCFICNSVFTQPYFLLSIDPCDKNTCLNGGICEPSTDLKNFTCFCKEKTRGRFCQITEKGKQEHSLSFPFVLRKSFIYIKGNLCLRTTNTSHKINWGWYNFCDFQNCIYWTYWIYIFNTTDVNCEPTPCYGNTSVCVATPFTKPYFMCINCPADKTGYRCQLGELCLIKILNT